MEIDHDSDIPVYLQLAAILRERIRDGTYPPRRVIPSRKSLVQEYGVAPGTCDKAVAVLKREGLARTVTGRGIFVTDPGERPGRET